MRAVNMSHMLVIMVWASPAGVRRPYSFPLGAGEASEHNMIYSKLYELGVVGSSPPLGSLSLLNHNPNQLYELGAIAVRLVEIVRTLHSIGLTHGFIARSKFNYGTMAREPSSIVLIDVDSCIFTDPGSDANTKLRWRDIALTLDVIYSFIPRKYRYMIPAEFALMRHRFKRTHILDMSIYSTLMDLGMRLSPPMTMHNLVFPFYRVMTSQELSAFSFGNGVDEVCPPATIPLARSPLERYRRLGREYQHGKVHEYSAAGLGGRKVRVKYWTDSTSYPDAMIRERAALYALRDLDGVVRTLDVYKDSPMSPACRTRVLITESSWGIQSLAEIAVVSRQLLIALGRRGIDILAAIHGRGFVHAGIHGDAWTVNFRKSAESLTLRNFEFARPWIVPFEGPKLQKQPMGHQSIFELEGHLSGRRDDLFRFAELLLRLTGEPDFARWPDDEDLSPALTARMKRYRQVVSSKTVPSCVLLFYLDVVQLQPDDHPAYDRYIQRFERCDE